MAITVHLSEILKERGMTALLLLDLCGGVLATGAARDRAGPVRRLSPGI